MLNSSWKNTKHVRATSKSYQVLLLFLKTTVKPISFLNCAEKKVWYNALIYIKKNIDLSSCFCLFPTCVLNLMLTNCVTFAPSHHSSQSHFPALLLLLLLKLSNIYSSSQLPTTFNSCWCCSQEALLGWFKENYDSRKTREAATSKCETQP